MQEIFVLYMFTFSMTDFIDTDFLFNDNRFPLFSVNIVLPPLITENPLDIFSPHPDILALNSQLEQLNLDIHTQSLRVEVKMAKRQKLRTKPYRIKKELVPENKFINAVTATINQLQESVNTLRQLCKRDLAHLRTVSYLCFSHVH